MNVHRGNELLERWRDDVGDRARDVDGRDDDAHEGYEPLSDDVCGRECVRAADARGGCDPPPIG